MQKRVKIIIGISALVIVIAAILLFRHFSSSNSLGTGSGGNLQQANIKPLSPEQAQIVAQSIMSNGITEDLSDSDPVGVMFYGFDENGQRYWTDGFLVGNQKFLTQGTPPVTIIMHEKYISEMTGDNLCEIVGEANRNGDLDVQTSGNKAALLLKYAKLLKYKDCLN